MSRRKIDQILLFRNSNFPSCWFIFFTLFSWSKRGQGKRGKEKYFIPKRKFFWGRRFWFFFGKTSSCQKSFSERFFSHKLKNKIFENSDCEHKWNFLKKREKLEIFLQLKIFGCHDGFFIFFSTYFLFLFDLSFLQKKATFFRIFFVSLPCQRCFYFPKV